VDVNLFQKDASQSNVLRKSMGISQNSPVIMFASAKGEGDKRKGFDEAMNALMRVSKKLSQQIHCVVVGGEKKEDEHIERLIIHRFGHVSDDKTMVSLYGASDLFIAPSLEDNLPNTILEAMSCGTPCLAYNVGGIPEIINKDNCGFLADPSIPMSLADRLEQALLELKDPIKRTVYSREARNRIVLSYEQKEQVGKFIEVCVRMKEKKPKSFAN
jgi:glycosyltransferase involved in cell wall biosynthesis